MNGLNFQDMGMETDQGIIPPPPFNPLHNRNAIPGTVVTPASSAKRYGTAAISEIPAHQQNMQLQQGHGSGNVQMVPTGIPGQFQPRHVDVQQWQQNQYMPVDSGVNSTSSSAPVSVYGNIEYTDIPANDQIPAVPYNPHSGFPGESMTGSMESGISMDISGPAVAAINLPELVRWLLEREEGEEEVVASALEVVSTMANDSQCLALAQEPQIVPAIVQATNHLLLANIGIDKEALTRSTLKTFYSLSDFPEGQRRLLLPMAIEFLVGTLRLCVQDNIVNLATSTMHNLLDSPDPHIGDAAKHELSRQGVVQAMMPLLRAERSDLKIIVCDCLGKIAVGNQAAKAAILASNGPSELLCIVQTSKDEILLQHVTGVLKAISVERDNKKDIIHHGGIEILISCVQNNSFESSKVATNILLILRNLSNLMVASKETIKFDCLLEPLVHLLGKQTTDRAGVETRPHLQAICAACILTNLTSGNDYTKIKICQLGGIEGLLKACQRFPDREQITEPAMCTLRHLTSGHAEMDRARTFVGQLGGLNIIAEIIQQPTHLITIKAMLGLIKNLAMVPQHLQPLRDSGIMDRLVDLLFEVYPLIWNNSTGQWNMDVTISNVKVHEIIAGCIDALAVIIKDPLNRNRIRINRFMSRSGDICILNVLINALRFPAEQAARSAATVLEEFTSDREGQALSIQYGAVPALTELRQRLGQANPFVKRVTQMLYNLSEGQPADYRAALQAQINQQIELPEDNFNGSEYQYSADPHLYSTSGPPSVYGSVYGTALSVANSDLLSEFDMQPSTPANHIWDGQTASATSQSTLGHSNQYAQAQRPQTGHQQHMGQWPASRTPTDNMRQSGGHAKL